jgi:hypothetical protein
MPGRRPWSTRALSSDGNVRRVEVKIAEGSPFDDIQLLAAYRQTTVSGLMRSLAEEEIRHLDTQAARWRDRATVMLGDHTSPLRRGINAPAPDAPDTTTATATD